MYEITQAIEERIDRTSVWVEIECLWSIICAVEDYYRNVLKTYAQ